MVVVRHMTLINDDVRSPARKCAHIHLDFDGEEDVPLLRQGDHTTKTVRFVILNDFSQGSALEEFYHESAPQFEDDLRARQAKRDELTGLATT
jgi:hypothetical protein